MTPERWRQITEVFHAARAREVAARAAFLDQACAADLALRAEVDALLAAESDRGAPLPPRTTVGPYRIETLIGRGTTGEVYRARDPRLGRNVAIKVLPRQLADDPLRRERLLKEVRLAAALNHPNICTVHEVGQVDGRDYIVFEHIEGRVLARLEVEGGMALGQLLELFLPVGEALDYAHRCGIVHRGLEPANVMVSALGRPKILDFGLATAGGRAARYVSPEQAQGRPVDARSDMFAFGCLMYEMASGRRAFEVASDTEITGAVHSRDPEPLAALRPDLPAGLGQIVERCLRREPEARYPHMSEVAAGLRDLQPHRHASASWPGVTVRRAAQAGPVRRVRPVALTLALVLLGVFAYRRLGTGAAIPRLANPVQVTVAASLEDYPTWSPDGRTVAYESNETGAWDIWVTRVGGGAPVNRTSDHSGDDRYPSWSPDGRQIAFWSDREDGGYYVVPAQGGGAQRVTATETGPGRVYYSPPQWSHDGKDLAYVIYAPVGARLDSFVEIQTLASREVRRLPLSGSAEHRLDLSWSRDGRHLAYVDAASQDAETTQLRVLRLSDGENFAVTDESANVRGPIWSADGRHLYYSTSRVGISDLWRQPMSGDGTPAGEAQQVTTGVEVRHAGFSSDGRRIAFTKGRWVANVWRVPLGEAWPVTWAHAEQLTFEEAFIEFLDVSPDGRRILFSSDRAGNQDLWTMPVGGELTRLTADPAPEWGPRWSPDERQIAFYASRTGDREIWTMPAEGGPARQLTRSPGLDAGVSWSPDGSTIAFRSQRTGNSEIWTIGSDGRDERQLTHDSTPDYGPAFSPDGRWLAFSSGRGGALQLWRMPAKGGTPERLSRQRTVSPLWARDGQRLYFASVDREPRLWEHSLKDGAERVVAELGARRGSLSLQPPATDGKSLYFSWRADIADIWVMDVGRE